MSSIPRLLLLLALLQGLTQAATTEPLSPDDVAIVFNSQDDESQALAIEYARLRNIPATNLIPLDLPMEDTISRAQYNTLLRDPLVKTFDREVWWSRRADPAGSMIPVRTKIRVLLLMKGVPFRIKREAAENGPDGKPIRPKQGMENEASVDSELVYLGIEKYSLDGPLNNPYFQKDLSLTDSSLTPLLFTCRIDAPSYATCKRIITDSMEVEENSLWGFCYLDKALKGKNYTLGDDWLDAISRHNRKTGIPTITERTRDTYPTNYPMEEAAFYYGWYAPHMNGPLLNPNFKFKKGAIAMHLHSFSAAQLRNPKRHWVGPILEKGAAATVGNVWEPYLAATHHFNILHERLLAGYSLVEAAHMAMPVHSWQSVVIGDPLYRPFAPREDQPTVSEEDRAYYAYKLALTQWGSQPDTLVVKLRTAAARMSSGSLYEALGLRRLEENNIQEARAFFESAGRSYPGASNKLRQQLHLIDSYRRTNEKEAALELIATAQQRFQDLPEAKSLLALKTILDPPAPPPAKSKAGSQ